MSSIAAVAVAPRFGFWIMQHGGWRWILHFVRRAEALMGCIAFALTDATSRADSCFGLFYEQCTARIGSDHRRTARVGYCIPGRRGPANPQAAHRMARDAACR